MFCIILSINRLNVLRWTPRIWAICVLEMPLASKFFIFLVFLESFSFFDSAVKGRPSFFPEALILARLDLVRSDTLLTKVRKLTEMT